MQIACTDLPRHLASGLKPLYVIHGDALLLAIEAGDSIRAAARADGYSEREVLEVDAHFKWGALRNSAQSVSLFSPRKLVDLRIPGGKPGVEGAKMLQAHAESPLPDVLTLITLPAMDKTTRKTRWFGALEAHGVLVSADDVPRAALPGWIAGRLAQQSQQADAETLAFMAERCEGNLLAAHQEIRKLALLHPAGLLSFEQVKDAVMDVARYNIFKMSEALLDGDAARFTRILEGLRGEGTATTLVLWSISEDIRAMLRVLQATRNGIPMSEALRQARIWGPRTHRVERAAKRLRAPLAERALLLAARIDREIKGLHAGDVWDDLLQLGIRLAK